MICNRRRFTFALAGLALGRWYEGASAAIVGSAFVCRALIDRNTIGYDDEFDLTALIEWRSGDGRIFLPLSWGLRGFQVAIFDAQGTKSPVPINNFHPPPPGMFASADNFLHMRPGMVVGDKLNVSVREFFPARGSFTIRVGYVSPVPRAFTSVPGAVLFEDGIVEAPPIRATVI